MARTKVRFVGPGTAKGLRQLTQILQNRRGDALDRPSYAT